MGVGWVVVGIAYLAAGAVGGVRAIILEAPAPLVPRWHWRALHMPPLIGPLPLPGWHARAGQSWQSWQSSAQAFMETSYSVIHEMQITGQQGGFRNGFMFSGEGYRSRGLRD